MPKKHTFSAFIVDAGNGADHVEEPPDAEAERLKQKTQDNRESKGGRPRS